jgi:hypothetical protein
MVPGLHDPGSAEFRAPLDKGESPPRWPAGPEHPANYGRSGARGDAARVRAVIMLP